VASRHNRSREARAQVQSTPTAVTSISWFDPRPIQAQRWVESKGERRRAPRPGPCLLLSKLEAQHLSLLPLCVRRLSRLAG
jgi:hypothetical protein